MAGDSDQGDPIAPALGGGPGATGGNPINPDKPINPLGTPSNSGYDPNAGGGPGAPPPQPTDWSSLLGIYGMPPDVAAAVGKIFADNPDTNQAIALALAYIRGTDWYSKTYPGIQYGMANGLFSNEAGYRAYVNAIDQYYRQYLGRAPTADEITGFLQNGSDPSIVGKTLEGNAYASAYKGDIEYYSGNFGGAQLSKEDLQAYGQEKVGLGSSTGYKVEQMVNQAIARYQGAFSGGAGSNPSGVTIGPAGLAATGLAGQRESLSQGPDISAA